MAETDFGALSSAKRRAHALKVWKEGRVQSFWFANDLVSRGSDQHDRPVQRITELTKNPGGAGDRCTMHLVHDAQSDGVAGDQELEGNEEALDNETQTIQIDQLRHAHKNRGAMAEQRTVIRFRTTAREKLSHWLADRMDQLMFLTGSGRGYTLNLDGSARSSSTFSQLAFSSDVVAASSNRILYGGTATSEGTIATTSKMTWDLLTKSLAFAGRKRIKPIRAGGGESTYIVVMSPEQLRDLRQDSDFKEIVSRGQARGAKNPLFTTAAVRVHGLAIFESDYVYNTFGLVSGSTKWGSSQDVDGAQALLLGAQAVGFATPGEPGWNESDKTDYGNKMGVSYGQIFGMLKPQYKSIPDSNSVEDFGVVSIKTAAAET